MRNATLKNKLVIVFMMAVFGLTVSIAALAHDQIGALGEPADATDYYLVTCSTDAGGVTGKLEVLLFDPTRTQGGGKMSAVVKHGNIVRTASDPQRVQWQNGNVCTGISEPDTEYGPPVSVHGGNGTYDVMVHKQKQGPKNYVLQYHCKTNTGIHTGSSLIVIQDQ
jgi:hypothetical protein